ncbi:MAG: Flp pilus assembly protein CpaB [Planctomycetaceae bacterium]|nr:Flp pilus assembly protein CpaB [Planctomycetaceae bacterium]
MKLTPWMLAVAAFLIVAALSVGFIFKKLFAAQPPKAPEVARRNVPMALSDIEPGIRIQSNYLGEGPADPDKLTPDTVLSVNALAGRVARNRISAATPIRLSDLYPVGQGPEINIAPGNRLVSVSVGDSTGIVSGLIRPGNYVDVMMSLSGVRSGNRSRDAMVLQLFDGVRVYAVNGSSTTVGGGIDRNEVTLEVSPDQQKILVLAKDKGEISLTYNPSGPGNGGVSVHASRSDRLMLSEILGLEEEEADEPFVTEQFRNGIRSAVYYDENGRPMSRMRALRQGATVDGTYNGGSPLQGSDVGSAGWDATLIDDSQRSQDLTQLQGTGSGSL